MKISVPFRISITLHLAVLGALVIATLFQGCTDKKPIKVLTLVSTATVPVQQPSVPQASPKVSQKLPDMQKRNFNPMPPKVQQAKPVVKNPPVKKTITKKPTVKKTPVKRTQQTKKVSYKDFQKTNPVKTPRVKPQPRQTPSRDVPTPSFNSDSIKKTLNSKMSNVKAAPSRNSQLTASQEAMRGTFRDRLLSLIERNWNKPNAIGDVVVRITVSANGSISASIITSSGVASIDQSVLRAIKSVGNSMGPPPGGKQMVIPQRFRMLPQ